MKLIPRRRVRVERQRQQRQLTQGRALMRNSRPLVTAAAGAAATGLAHVLHVPHTEVFLGASTVVAFGWQTIKETAKDYAQSLSDEEETLRHYEPEDAELSIVVLGSRNWFGAGASTAEEKTTAVLRKICSERLNTATRVNDKYTALNLPGRQLQRKADHAKDYFKDEHPGESVDCFIVPFGESEIAGGVPFDTIKSDLEETLRKICSPRFTPDQDQHGAPVYLVTPPKTSNSPKMWRSIRRIKDKDTAKFAADVEAYAEKLRGERAGMSK